ncbi:MAG: hypothetical protein GXY97_11160 [Clostridiales bacterium]|jgi:hypothetical protein|nr:hypothetical protein [Clostridiales bacterium]NLZ92321.1 hypothetical protein [Clostridiales bacterium]HQA59311.1 hypothetical protein [Acetivibrio sp.]HQE06189.1 hypothetical protein [Tepidanaerobacteraceae bacterium]
MKRKKILTLILVLAIMLAGCSQAGANLEAADAEPMVFEAGDENFAIKTYINKLEFDEGEEIKLHSTIEYIGQNESIAIWSGEPYFHHLIHDGDKYINSDIVLGILKETVLKKGEVYTIPFSKSGGFTREDPDAEFWEKYFSEKELRLPTGDYTFTAVTDFCLDMDQEEKVTLRTEFKVKVK